MASRNPVLIRATGESFGGETIEQGSLAQPEYSGARLTMDDVIVKTGMLFALLLVAHLSAGQARSNFCRLFPWPWSSFCKHFQEAS
jgi:uncharacterized YccA/Bax inhibitor family protein